jgi:hypothetical protein
MTRPMSLPDEQYNALVNVNGVYEIDFRPSSFNRMVTQIAVQGPPGSSLSVFLDQNLYDSTPRGDLNTADYGPGRPVPRGRQLRLVWSVGTGLPVPFCTASFVRVS